MYSYLIIHNGEAFFTNYWNEENFMEGMIIITGGKISFDGKTFNEIKEDSL